MSCISPTQPTKLWQCHNATPDDRSGTAAYQVGDSARLTMRLECYADYLSIGALMDAAYALGFKDSKEVIKNKIDRLTGEL